MMIHMYHICTSHPTWVRGLKPAFGINDSNVYTVAPYVGAWIETCSYVYIDTIIEVAPYVGAWIETQMSYYRGNTSWSHPTWVRGLKRLNMCLSM